MNNTERDEALRLAAEAVASAMRPPVDIRRGLQSITSDSLHSPKLAQIVREVEDLSGIDFNRIIRIEPRY